MARKESQTKEANYLSSGIQMSLPCIERHVVVDMRSMVEDVPTQQAGGLVE